MAMIKCRECGSDISDTTKKCIHCGAKVIVKKDGTKGNNTTKIIIAIGVIIAIAAIGIMVFIFGKKEYYEGLWQHAVSWSKAGKVTRESYASFTFDKDGTFSYHGVANGEEKQVFINGTFTENNGVLNINYNEDGKNYSETLYIDGDKLCVGNKDCKDYYVKSTSKMSNSLFLVEEIQYITYDDYQNILYNNNDAIVAFVQDNCPSCDDFKKVLDEVNDKYSIAIYLVNIKDDTRIKISSTPTTHIIKNGKIVNNVVGGRTYEEFTGILNNVLSEETKESETKSNTSKSSETSKNTTNNSEVKNNTATNSNSSSNNSSSNPAPETSAPATQSLPSVSISNVSGIGSVYKEYGTTCTLDSFNYTVSRPYSTSPKTVKIEYNYTATMTEQKGDWKWCKFRLKVYDGNNILVKNASLFSDMSLNETAYNTNSIIFENDGSVYSIKLESE